MTSADPAVPWLCYQQPSESPKHELKSGSAAPPVATAGQASAASSSEAQLKYENDRLKLALAQRCVS